MSVSTPPGKRRRGRTTRGPAAQPKQDAEPTPTPESSPATTSWWSRPDAIVAAGIIVLALLLFGAFWELTETRSFHADELTNLQMHILREQGVAAEQQHGRFHDFYAWWLSGERFDERYARIPAMLMVSVGLLVFSALGGRLAGRRGAVLAAIVYIAWPRTWDDAQEMRYYSLISLSAGVALHALLSLGRGWIYAPLAVLAGLLWLMVGWHLTAVAWHAAALMAGLALAGLTLWGRFQEWRQAPLESRGPFPWRRLGLPAAFGGVGLVGALVVMPSILRRLSGQSLEFYIDRGQQLKPAIGDLAAWLCAWVADSFSPAPAWAWLPVPGFLALLALGVWWMWKSQRWLLVTLLTLTILQLTGALVFGTTWRFIAQAPKYTASTGVVLALTAVLGAAAAFQLLTQRRWLAAVAFALLFVAPLLPRTAVSAFGDASHFRQLWTSVMEEAGDRVPLALVVGEAKQSSKIYRYLIPRFVVHEAIAESYIENPAAIGLMARRNPVYTICHPHQMEKVQATLRQDPLQRYPSNFTPNWDFLLMGPPQGIRVAAGSPAALTKGSTMLQVLEAGSWRLEGGPATVAGKPESDGAVLALTPGAIAIETDGDRRLEPVLVNEAIRREGAFASDGPVDSWNTPIYLRGHRAYMLSNVFQVEYDLHIPEDANRLVLEIERDAPRNGALSVRLGKELVGLFIDAAKPNDPGPGSLWQVTLPLPKEFRGRDETISVAFHGENSIRDANDEKVRVLILRALRLERRAVDDPVSENQLVAAPLAPPPQWAPEGSIDFRKAGTESLLKLANQIQGSWENPTITHSDRGLMINFPETFPSQIAAFPPTSIDPNRVIAFELEARGRNLIVKNAAPMISFYNAAGEILRSGQLSQSYITSEDPDWTKRLFLEMPPEDAVYCVLGFYLNCPVNPNTRTRDDSRVDVRGIRFYSEYRELTP